MPPSSSKEQSTPVVWRLAREIGGVPIVVAAIVFAARLDANVTEFSRAAERLAAAVEALTTQQRALDRAGMRDGAWIAELEPRLREVEEARHDRR